MRKKFGLRRFISWFVIALLASFIIVNFIGPKKVRLTLIDGDGSGLYAYLPSVLIYKTVDFTKIYELEKQHRPSSYQAHYFRKQNGVMINKYTFGTALLQLPFFLLAWITALLAGFPANGYTPPFQYGVGMAALFWAFIGVLYLIKLARTYGIKDKWSMPGVLTLFFGTNLFYYTLLAPSASHVYSFGLISVFLYQARLVFTKYSIARVGFLSALLGLVVLVRPVNLLIITILPFLAGSAGMFLDTIRNRLTFKTYLYGFVILLLVLSPQLLINTLQTGSPFVDGYQDEGFRFLHPHFVDFLFSYRKGWFVYTPVMLLLVPAVIFNLKRSVYETLTFTLFFLLQVYVFSSWWNWIYGDSFGMRPMVDYYSLFLLIILIFVNDIKSLKIRQSLGLVVSLAVFLNLFQTYQYAEGILHPDSMNKKAYWYVFLRAGKQYKGVISDNDEYFYGELSDKPFFSTAFSFQNENKGWSQPKKIFYVPDEDHPCLRTDKNMPYSSSFNYPISKEMTGKNHIYVKFAADCYEPHENNALQSLFVVDITDANGHSEFYKAFRLKRLPDKTINTWQPAHIGFKLPLITPSMKSAKFYIWNKEGKEFYLRSLKLEMYYYQ